MNETLTLVTIENPTRVPVYGFWFKGMNVEILDNQRKDVPLEMAKAMVAQYPFLKVITDIEELREEIKTVQEEIAELQNTVDEMRDTSNQVELQRVDGHVPKGFKRPLTKCEKCGAEVKGTQGLRMHERHKHSENGTTAFKSSVEKMIYAQRQKDEKGKDDGHGERSSEVHDEKEGGGEGQEG